MDSEACQLRITAGPCLAARSIVSSKHSGQASCRTTRSSRHSRTTARVAPIQGKAAASQGGSRQGAASPDQLSRSDVPAAVSAYAAEQNLPVPRSARSLDLERTAQACDSGLPDVDACTIDFVRSRCPCIHTFPRSITDSPAYAFPCSITDLWPQTDLWPL